MGIRIQSIGFVRRGLREVVERRTASAVGVGRMMERDCKSDSFQGYRRRRIILVGEDEDKFVSDTECSGRVHLV